MQQVSLGVEVAVRTLGMPSNRPSSPVLASPRPGESAEQREIRQYKAAFLVFDLTGDGVITIEELFTVLEASE